MTEQLPLRVAQIMTQMNWGGAEGVIINYYSAIDRDLVQFDFFAEEGSSLPCRELLLSLGANIRILPPLHKPVAYISALRKLLRGGRYQIIHSNANTLSAFPLFAAWCERVPVRICHNHSTSYGRERKKTLMKYLLRPFARLFATDYFACGRRAAEWMYGKKNARQGRVYIVPNAIPLDAYRYDEAARMSLRAQLSLGDKLVLGHVGRCTYAKNQLFLLDILVAVRKRHANACLVLAGEGELRAEMDGAIASRGLEAHVLMLGNRGDIPAVLSAMDVFLLPSLYEGLPVVAIEAQACGLPCLFSTHITREIDLSDTVRFLPPKDAGEWADTLLSQHAEHADRRADLRRLADAGFDIHAQARALTAFYLARAGLETKGDTAAND